MATSPTIKKKAVKGTRVLAQQERRFLWFRIKMRHPEKKLPSAYRLLMRSLVPIRFNWRAFAGIAVIHVALTVLFVQGLNNQDAGAIRSTLDSMIDGRWGGVIASILVFAYMAGSSGQTTSAESSAGVYQLLLVVITSLAVVWVLRQSYAGNVVRVRDGYYKGMYPFVIYLLVLVAVLVQLIPLLIGGFLYNIAIGGAAVSGVEILLWNVLFFVLVLISLYLLSSTLIATYIACLPEMTPRKALRSAKGLVQGRRWTVIRKVLFLPVFLLIAAAVCIVPIIAIAAPLAGIAFLLAGVVGLVVVHAYMYGLYRELL